jgi:hypothetical protein
MAAKKKTSKNPNSESAATASSATIAAGKRMAASGAPSKHVRRVPLIRTKSGKRLSDVLGRAHMALEPSTPAPSAKDNIAINVKITQEDIDAQLLFTMLDSNSGLLSSLHALALEGKKWLISEPDKANLFLATAKKTTSYRPLKMLFDMMELDEEILKVPSPTTQGKNNIQAAFNTGTAFISPLSSILKNVQQIGINLNLDV